MKRARARASVRARELFFSFASVVMLTVVSPAFGVGGVQPPGYTEGLKVDKDGMVRALDTDVKITFPNGVAVNAANIGAGKEFYIAYRTDTPACVQNVCGGGTKLDPYDGSQRVKFDSTWAHVVAAGARSVTVMPSASPYLTNGALELISNCVISGWGATLKADVGTGVSEGRRSIFNNTSTATNGCTVQGFTFDCNLMNQTAPNSLVQAIQIRGANNHVLHNKFIQFGTRSLTSLECFVVGIFGTNTIAAYGNEIAYNEATQAADSTAAGTTIFSLHAEPLNVTDLVNPNGSWQHGGKIHHNNIHDISDTDPVHGMSVGAFSVSQELTDNVCSNLSGLADCIYSDTGASYGAVIARNTITNVNIAIGLAMTGGGGHIQTNTVITDNNIFLSTATLPCQGIVIFGGPFVRMTVTNNHIYRYSPSGGVSYGFYFESLQDSLIKDNRTGPNVLTNYLANSTNVQFVRNTLSVVTLSGNTNLQTASNHKNDGTRLVLSTDTDVYQKGNADLGDVVANSVGSNLFTSTGYQARNVEVATRTITDADITFNNADVLVVIKGPNTTTHTISLPAAPSNNGRFLYIADESGDISTHAYTANLKSGAFAFNINNGRITIRSNGTHWVLWDLFTPP